LRSLTKEKKFSSFFFQGSGWVVGGVDHLSAEVVRCRKLAGGTCGPHTCQWKRGQGVVVTGWEEKPTTAEEDGFCFYLAVASHFCPEKTVTSQMLEEYARDNFAGDLKRDKFDLSAVERFEKENEHLNLSINIIYQVLSCCCCCCCCCCCWLFF
jgi:hypothetical protein